MACNAQSACEACILPQPDEAQVGSIPYRLRCLHSSPFVSRESIHARTLPPASTSFEPGTSMPVRSRLSQAISAQIIPSAPRPDSLPFSGDLEGVAVLCGTHAFQRFIRMAMAIHRLFRLYLPCYPLYRRA